MNKCCAAEKRSVLEWLGSFNGVGMVGVGMAEAKEFYIGNLISTI